MTTQLDILKRDGPSLQKLVEEHGGYDKITPEAWAVFHVDTEWWLRWLRGGGKYYEWANEERARRRVAG
jgi:hypothetical protein